ncbi:hypothetical protein [Sphingomonas sp. Leaf10]|uniref:hypothetical protein n=1 Tax=Sphingomonas sp. Leaf10 TaxID=1735676 RepID=UPI0012E1F4FD|nr:hypothetical protein [Sphingomonas sp. Leaf10]
MAVAVAIAAAFISYLQYDAQITLGRKAQEATDKQMALAEQSARDSARETQEALALTRRSVEAQRILADEYAKTAIFTGKLASSAVDSVAQARSAAQLSQRAYLEFEIESLPATMKPIGEGVNQETIEQTENFSKIVLVIRNSGNTPAFNVSGSYRTTQSIYKDFTREDEYDTGDLAPIGALTKISRQQVALVQLADDEHLLVEGSEKFYDIFGNAHNEKFCIRVLMTDVEACPGQRNFRPANVTRSLK